MRNLAKEGVNINEMGDVVQLSMDQRLKLCLLMKNNFNAGVKQISRVTRLDPELVSKVV